MSGRVAAAAGFAACIMFALWGFRDDSVLLYPTGVMAAISLMAAKRAQRQQDEQTLRENRIRRVQIGRDTLYLQDPPEDE